MRLPRVFRLCFLFLLWRWQVLVHVPAPVPVRELALVALPIHVQVPVPIVHELSRMSGLRSRVRLYLCLSLRLCPA